MLKKILDAQSHYQPAAALIELSRISLESSERLIGVSVRQVRESLNNSSALIGKLASTDPQAYPDLAITQTRQGFSKGIADLTELANAVVQTQASLLMFAGKAWQFNAAK